MTTQQNAPVLAKHRDEAAKAAGYRDWAHANPIAPPTTYASIEHHAQEKANLEAANNRLAEIDRIAAAVTDVKSWSPLGKIAALASGHAPSPCPSCDGMNISCPEGCERDPLTGELVPWECPDCAAKDEAMAERAREVSDAVTELLSWPSLNEPFTRSRLERFIIPPADPVAEALKAAIHAYGGELIEGENFDMAVAELKSRLPLGGAK